MAQLHAKGQLKIGEQYIHESYIGSTFTGQIEGLTMVGKFDAIIPSIKGWARVFAHSTIVIDTDDPYAFGFQVL
jgi:4-hydroxyproline epimerase